MKIVDLSGSEIVSLRIDSSVFVVSPEIKIQIINFLNDLGCPKLNKDSIPPEISSTYIRQYNDGKYVCQVVRDPNSHQKCYILLKRDTQQALFVTDNIDERDRFLHEHNWVADSEWR